MYLKPASKAPSYENSAGIQWPQNRKAFIAAAKRAWTGHHPSEISRSRSQNALIRSAFHVDRPYYPLRRLIARLDKDIPTSLPIV